MSKKQNDNVQIPAEYKPLGAWAYFFLSILYSIPIIGIIFLILHSINGSNINRRSYARSHWIPYVLVFGFFVICAIASNSLFSMAKLTEIIESISSILLG